MPIPNKKQPRKSKKAQKAPVALPRCPKCGHKHSIKSGMVQGEQRYKCKSCMFQFTRLAPRGRPIWQKTLSVFLYSNGVPLYAIADIFHIQPSTVLKWVRSYAAQNTAHSAGGGVMIMNMQDMQSHLKGIGKGKSDMLLIAIKNTALKGRGIVIE